MPQLELFAAPPPLPDSPGERDREAAQRRAWRKRQRRHRALKKWRERIAGQPMFEMQAFPSEAESCLVGAVFVAREFAARAFAAAVPEDIQDDALRLLFGAAREVFDSGAPVTRQAVEKHLKRHGVLLIHADKLIDTLTLLLPPHFSARRVDFWAGEVKKSA